MDAAQNIFAYGMQRIEGHPSYADLVKDLGQPLYRAKQLAQWLWKRDALNYDEMDNLPLSLREGLACAAPLRRAKIEDVQRSSDSTRKYLLRFADGVSVETVGLPGDTPGRLTVCVSAQAGCRLSCSFCATGQGGFVRDLLPGEIAEQVRIVAKDYNQRVSHVVIMGQGEPFLNYPATISGMRIINSADGLGVGARHITVSSAGIIPGIERFSHETEQFTLAVSLHSATQATRDALMPGLSAYPLERLRKALRDYFTLSGRRPSLEYALIAGVNDTPAEAVALIDFARTVRAHINLIPLNESLFAKGLQGSSEEATRRFVHLLQNGGVEVSVRTRRGADIAAACGQLSQQ